MSRIGANPTLRTTVADFELLDENKDEDGRVWLYVQADGLIAVNKFVIIDDAGQAVPYNNANSAAAFGDRCGVVTADFADDDYGWVCIEGTGTDIAVLALTLAAANVELNGTATSGTLDDDATSGAEIANGVVLVSTNGGSTAAVQCILTRPTVGATIA